MRQPLVSVTGRIVVVLLPTSEPSPEDLSASVVVQRRLANSLVRNQLAGGNIGAALGSFRTLVACRTRG